MQRFDATVDPASACANDLFPLLREHRVPTVRFNPLSSYQAPLVEYPRHYQFLHDFGCDGASRFYMYYLFNLPLLFATSGFSPLFQFYALRLGAWLLFLIHLWVAHRIGRLLFNDPMLQAFLPVTLGLHPLFVAVHTWISYDVLLNLLFSLNVFVTLSFMLQKGPFTRVGRFLGASTLLTALAVFTKPSGVALLLATLAALLLVRHLPSRTLTLLWGGFGIVGGLAAFRFLTLQKPSLEALLHLGSLFELFIQRPWIAFESFWGGWGFGWMDTYAPPLFILLFLLLTVMGFLGTFRTLLRSFLRRTWLTEARVLLFCLFILVGFEGLAVAYNLFFPPVSLVDSGFVQGRYYFPIIIPLLLVLFYGWSAWGKPSLARSRWVSGVFWGLLLVYHLIYLNVILIPRYYF